MLSAFDWLRRTRNGAELLATLSYLSEQPLIPFEPESVPGAPYSATNGPCRRCQIYPRLDSGYCKVCHQIMTRAARSQQRPRQAVVAWGYVNRLPRNIVGGGGFYERHAWGLYIHDARRFLLMMHCRELKNWLQELMLYHGSSLTGTIVIFPTIGTNPNATMGDCLTCAVAQETPTTNTNLTIRFFSSPYQLFRPHIYRQRGLLDFEAGEFLNLLEMAAVFRSVLPPRQQAMLHSLLRVRDPGEQQFYWGRFLGYLSAEARDMLQSWRIRLWPRNRVELMYKLVEYVELYQTD